MMRLSFLYIISVVLACTNVLPGVEAADYYTAIIDVGRAMEVGRELSAELKIYLKMEEARLNEIRVVAEHLDEAQNASGFGNFFEKTEEYLSNPVNAYVTVDRLAANWKERLNHLIRRPGENSKSIDEVMGPETFTQVVARVEEKANLLPGVNDVDGAADALFRLQDTYQLSAEELAQGRIYGTKADEEFTATQCTQLGQHAYDQGDFPRAEEWFRVAYTRLLDELRERDYQVQRNRRSAETVTEHELLQLPTIEQVLDHLSYALGRQGRYEEALNMTKLILSENPFNDKAESNKRFYEEHLRIGEGRIGPAPPPEMLTPFQQETETYQAMCRGENPFPPPPDNKVYCRYYVPHPYYKIGPVKEEVLFPDPRMVMWHEFIHSGEIRRIQELSAHKLRRSTVKNPVTGVLEFANYRTSKNAWLSEHLDEVTYRIFHRIEAVTGLSLIASEDLQVGNYGIGGYYAPHFDFGRKREKDAFEISNGNRIATIIFYMSDVKAGGSTVFNRIGARVEPIKGAAAFWWNLLPSGEGDLRTRHAACPVLIGSKWVMNMWFHERGQEFRRPCELERGQLEIDDGF